MLDAYLFGYLRVDLVKAEFQQPFEPTAMERHLDEGSQAMVKCSFKNEKWG
jgi:hypothetical protein